MDPRLIAFIAIAATLILVGILLHFQRRRGPEQPTKHLLEVGSFIAGIASALAAILFPLLSAPTSASQPPSAEPPTSAPASTPPTPIAPDTPGATSTPEPAAPYVEEHRDIPFTIRTAHDGRNCDPYISIDFDGGLSADRPITTRIVDEDELTTAQREAGDMFYVTCSNAELRASQNASVGLLRDGKNATPEQCAAAASASSLGNLDITKDAHPDDIGFTEGSAICALTPDNRLARATITKITYNAGIGNRIPTVEFSLSTWTIGGSG
jgi:hypothetical protein